ncbi:MAG: hypothetical protein QXL02_02865 [Candidatus Anstonellales archaeon]
MIVVDTDFLIDYITNKQAAVKKLELYIGREKLYITDLILAELTYTIPSPDVIESVIDAFEILIFDESAALEMINILKSFQLEEPPPFRILYNSSIALSKSLAVLTKNRSLYSRIRGVKIL